MGVFSPVTIITHSVSLRLCLHTKLPAVQESHEGIVAILAEHVREQLSRFFLLQQGVPVL